MKPRGTAIYSVLSIIIIYYIIIIILIPYYSFFTILFYIPRYAAIQQAPWILLSGMVLQPTVEAMVDDVKSVATIPMLLNDFPIPMGFLQRVFNVGMYAFMAVDGW